MTLTQLDSLYRVYQLLLVLDVRALSLRALEHVYEALDGFVDLERVG